MVQEFDSSDVTDVFPEDVEGLPDALPPVLVDLDDGDLLEMRIGPVRNSIGSDEVRMLAYNGSIPGPVFKVKQGTTVSVKVTNDAGLPQTVPWHGLRLENRFDGVPYAGTDFRWRDLHLRSSLTPACTGTTLISGRTRPRARLVRPNPRGARGPQLLDRGQSRHHADA
jgi:Multicopper oxidase